MDRETIVYKITCLPNGKLYIGITSNSMIKRWQAHVATSRKEKVTTAIAKAMRRYGHHQFRIEEIDRSPTRMGAGLREKALIEELGTKVPTGYNVADGGDDGTGWRKGHTMSPETRAKMSAASKGKKKSPEHVEKIRQRMTGNKLSPAHVEIIRQCGRANKGRKHTEADVLYFHIVVLRRSLASNPLCQSGFRSVRWEKNGWLVQFAHRGRNIYVGRFRTAEAGYAAYRKKAEEVLAQSERDFEALTGNKFEAAKRAKPQPLPVLPPPPIFLEAPKPTKQQRALKPLPLFEYAMQQAA